MRLLPILLAAGVAGGALAVTPLPNAQRGIGVQAGAAFESVAGASAGDEGDLGVERYGFGASYRLPLTNGPVIRPGFEQEYSRYAWPAGSSLAALPEDGAITRLNLTLQSPYGDDWWWMLAPSVRAAAMDGADEADGLTFYVLGLVNRRVNEKFGVGFGFIGRTALEEDATVFPIAGVQWMISERLLLRTTDEIILQWFPDEKRAWELDWRTSFRNRDYRLPEELDTTARGGVLAERQFSSTAGARWQFLPFASVRLYGGLAFARTIELRDRDGNELENRDIDAALLGGLEARVRF